MLIDILCWFIIALGTISGLVFFGVIAKEVLEHDWRKLMNLNLNYEGFEENLVERWEDAGVHYTFRFSNGYGASIVKTLFSYGYARDLWELAVIYFTDEADDDDWYITYDTPITDDVVGYLTNDKVLELLAEIRDLPEDWVWMQ